MDKITLCHFDMFHDSFWSIKHVPENDNMFLKNGICVPNFAPGRSAMLQLKCGFAGLRNTTESGQKFTIEKICKLLISVKLTTDS